MNEKYVPSKAKTKNKKYIEGRWKEVPNSISLRTLL